jgi:alpha-methylacyl-CoA racemase
LEQKFFDEMMHKLGLSQYAPLRHRTEDWKALHDLLERTFASRDQAHWVELFEGSDACVAPVLSLEEAMEHPQLKSRRTYVEHAGLRQAAPAPRFSRTPGAIRDSSDAAAMLEKWRRAGGATQ